jgi:perosamine synthetase
LGAAGIGPGDEVILCGFSCLAVPEAVGYAGATPVYADLAVGKWASGIAEIAACASDRTRAVVVQHSFGIPADVGPIAELARERGWLLIEDCALALGSMVGGRLLGTLGDAAIVSFEMTKTVTGGWGGVAIARRPDLAAAMSASYAAEPEAGVGARLREFLQVLLSVVLFSPAVFGWSKYVVAALYRSGIFRISGRPLAASPPRNWSHRLPRFSAALVVRQLRRLEDILARRGTVAAAYRRWLDREGRPDVSGPRAEGVALLRFPVLVDRPTELVDRARARGIELGRWFDAPVSPMPYAPESIGYRWGSCPRAEAIASQVVNLPLDPRMTAYDIARLLSLLGEFALHPLPGGEMVSGGGIEHARR